MTSRQASRQASRRGWAESRREGGSGITTGEGKVNLNGRGLRKKRERAENNNTGCQSLGEARQAGRRARAGGRSVGRANKLTNKQGGPGVIYLCVRVAFVRACVRVLHLSLF